jgi:xanthine dehydrogenase/oxidase
MVGEPTEGITDDYRIELAVGFLYKALVNALLDRAPESVPPAIRSSGVATWGRWPVSTGVQDYATQRTKTLKPWKAPVSVPYVKIMALHQATGRVHYTHEAGLPPSVVNAAFVQSRRALADYFLTVPGTDGPATPGGLAAHLGERFESFVDLITHEQIPPHGINNQGMGADQPLFAVERISYVGQAIALAIATTEQQAIAIAEYASEHCVGYRPVDWPAPWNEPVLTLDQAIGMGSVFPDYPASANFVSHVWKITRPGSDFAWVNTKDPLDKTIAVREHQQVGGLEATVVESTQLCGGQAHFYMETQACVAIPLDGDRLLVHPSTQSPMEMHQTVAMALGVQYHKLEVDVLQVGGGYGGKTEPARFVTGPTAVAAVVLRRPVRLAMKREHDTAMIGKRHAYYGQYQIAVDPGSERASERGRIRGLHCKMWGDGGAFYDCSFIVSNCIQLRADNAYMVANFENQIDVCRTNTAPNTAFRAFGDIQGKLLTENAIDDAAFAIGMSAEDVREKNLYVRGDVTPFGQPLSYCYMQDVWKYLKDKAGYAELKADVDAYNAANRWTKRGIAMVPVKYGSGYNFVQLEQAAVHVVVNSGDGSVIVHQGAVEMGQGALTIVEQVASYVLNVPMDLLHIESPNTNVLPNPSSTGASTGTTYNAAAVRQACQVLRERLLAFAYRMRDENGPDWCAAQQIDFWNYPDKGWATEVKTKYGPKLIWQNLVSQAFSQRVSLLASFTAPIAGGETPVPAMTFKPMCEQKPIEGITVDRNAPAGGAVSSFTGFTYSAACSVVEVDVLTGEVKILSSDIAYDAGWSLNPAIDIGQVEGAFVQGIGYVLTEQLVFETSGEEKGRLNTLNTWRYKPPATVTIPLRLNTYLFPRSLADVPENPDDLFSAKEIGEPPLVLAASVFFAVKYAVRASRVERGLDGLFRLDAPATVQEVRRACAVAASELAIPSS